MQMSAEKNDPGLVRDIVKRRMKKRKRQSATIVYAKDNEWIAGKEKLPWWPGPVAASGPRWSWAWCSQAWRSWALRAGWTDFSTWPPKWPTSKDPSIPSNATCRRKRKSSTLFAGSRTNWEALMSSSIMLDFSSPKLSWVIIDFRALHKSLIRYTRVALKKYDILLWCLHVHIWIFNIIYHSVLWNVEWKTSYGKVIILGCFGYIIYCT